MTTALVYNRPATVERRFETTARVRYLDNGTVDFVPVTEVGDD